MIHVAESSGVCDMKVTLYFTWFYLSVGNVAMRILP